MANRIMVGIILFHMGGMVGVALTAAIERTNPTAIDIDGDVTIERSQTAAAINAKIRFCVNALEVERDVARLVGDVATTEFVVHHQGTTFTHGLHVLDDVIAIAQPIGASEAPPHVTA